MDSGHGDIVKSERSPAGPDIDYFIWLLWGAGEREKEGGREGEGGVGGGQSISFRGQVSPSIAGSGN